MQENLVDERMVNVPNSTSPRDALTGRLASFAVETLAGAIPKAAFDPAKNLILDTLGVALAASQHPIGDIISGYVTSDGARATASILGRGVMVSPESAALANGTLANALDFDEGSHLSTHILPTALAVAEDQQCSGAELLQAFIIGYEAGARLSQVVDGGRRQSGPTHRGWWHVGLVGPIAAALTAARLFKLDLRQTTSAIGIATCSSGGFRRNMGTMAKALHSGNAARAGIQAARLAKRGFTADPEIIEAPLGFVAALCFPEERDPAAVMERLARPYMLESVLRLKRYPACNPGHPLIDAALKIVEQHSFAVADIDSIEADLHSFSLLRTEPWDEDSAAFSGAFLLAATLIHRQFGLAQLTEKTLHDPIVQGLMSKIKPTIFDGKEQVIVRLKDGRMIGIDVQPGQRLTAGQAVKDKFRRCAASALPPEAAAALEDMILNLEDQAAVAPIMKLARGRAQPPARNE